MNADETSKNEWMEDIGRENSIKKISKKMV
jgi:hypothetical protein